MSMLTQLQDAFQRAILDGDSAIRDAVVSNDAADASERVGVYVHAYTARLVEALRSDFPTLRFAAGDAVCADMLRDYVAATPSVHRNVRWYGGGLAEFLRHHPPWSDAPAFADMAAFDWAIGLSFDAEDEPCAGEEDIATLPPERWGEMLLRLPPHVRLFACEWNVLEIRQAHDRGQNAPSMRPLARPQTSIVSRQSGQVHYRQLAADEAAALTVVAAGAPFVQMCEALCDWHAQDDVALRAASLLKAWIGNGWIASVALPD